jgi:hypothetical protein
MEPQNTLNTRSGCGALLGEDDAFDLTARLADAGLPACRIDDGLKLG